MSTFKLNGLNFTHYNTLYAEYKGEVIDFTKALL